jgi:hypothetical protein
MTDAVEYSIVIDGEIETGEFSVADVGDDRVTHDRQVALAYARLQATEAVDRVRIARGEVDVNSVEVTLPGDPE